MPIHHEQRAGAAGRLRFEGAADIISLKFRHPQNIDFRTRHALWPRAFQFSPANR